MSDHHILAPSSAHRWLTCTGSAKFEAEFVNTSGDAAARGTLMHAVAAAVILRQQLDIEPDPKAPRASDLEPSERGLVQDYVEYIDGLVGAAMIAANFDQPKILVEKRLDLSHIAPGLFGTGDAAIATARELYVIDLKTGIGEVEAEGNEQLMLYASGFVELLYKTEAELADLRKIHLCISQPKTGTPKQHTITLAELADFELHAVQQAKEALSQSAIYVASEGCKYCRAARYCAAFQQDASLAATRAEHALLRPEHVASYEHTAYLVLNASRYKKAFDTLTEHAVQLALRGAPLAGTKLVEGRGTRYYLDQHALANRLVEAGYEKSLVYKAPEVVGLTELKGVLGAAKFRTLVEPNLGKKAGPPKIVAENAKGEAYQDLNSVFGAPNININN